MMKQWPGFLEKLEEILWPSVNHYKKYDGTLIGAFPIGDPDLPSIPLNRQELHSVLYEYAKALGISVELSTTVVDYLETEESGGVRLADGSKIMSDIVVAADGIGSKSRFLITGSQDRLISTGFAIYRASFPIKAVIDSNRVIAAEFEGFDRRVSLHVGPDSHIVIGKTEDEVCWMLTHRVRLFDSILSLVFH